MGKPAARLTDMHTCPMVTGLVPHVGGPITGPGAPTVLIGKLPAAVVGDMLVCTGPPDAIVMGSFGVLIGGKPAARMGDMTAHGGVIVKGEASVLIGETGFATAISHFVIQGNKDFKDQVIVDLYKIYQTPTGEAMLDAIHATGRQVSIVHTHGGNAVVGFTGQGMVQPNGKPGKGSDSTIKYNHTNEHLGGAEKWQTRPPAIGLAHELVHVHQAATGTVSVEKIDNDHKPDITQPSGIHQEKRAEVEAVGAPPNDNKPYSENKVRAEWDPQQPARPYY